MKKSLLAETISLLFILLFMYAAGSEIIDNSIFRFQLCQSPLVAEYAPVITWLIPAAELFTAGLLAFRITRITGSIVALLLMIVFSSYLGFTILNNEKLSSGFGGMLPGFSGKVQLGLNGIFIMLAFAGVFIRLKDFV